MGEAITTQSSFSGKRRSILQSTDDIFELVVKLGLFFFLAYWSIVLLRDGFQMAAGWMRAGPLGPAGV